MEQLSNIDYSVNQTDVSNQMDDINDLLTHINSYRPHACIQMDNIRRLSKMNQKKIIDDLLSLLSYFTLNFMAYPSLMYINNEEKDNSVPPRNNILNVLRIEPLCRNIAEFMYYV